MSDSSSTTTYVAVDPDALAHNTRAVLARVTGGARLMAVVKGNAYGHGLVEASEVFLEAGAAWLGVSSVAEGVALRAGGIDAPVLVFMPAAAEECPELVRANLTATVACTEHLQWLHEASEAVEKTARAQVFVDTGLSRLPSEDRAIDLLDTASGLGLKITGMYTHYGPPGSGAMADGLDLFKSGVSARMFVSLAEELRSTADRRDLLIHCASSALLLEEPKTHLDMVRVGTLLYGQYPDHLKTRDLDLQEAAELRSRVVNLGKVGVGGKMGYGGEFHARRETLLATVPVGYAHGLGMMPLSVAQRGRQAVKGFLARTGGAWGRAKHLPCVAIRGLEAPIVGRIAMDHCTVDVTDLPDVALGDEVVLPVRRTAVSPDIPRLLLPETC